MQDQIIIVGFGKNQFVAGSDQVGFDKIVEMLDAAGIGIGTARRTAGAIGCYDIVCAPICSEGVRRADGDSRWLNPWRVNLSVHFLTRTILTIVTGRSDDDDARINQAANSATDRVIFV